MQTLVETTGATSMDALIQVTRASLAGESVPAVSARDLHLKLEVRRDFTNWIKYQIARARLVEGVDFQFANFGEAANPRARVDCFLCMDAAKHLAMMSGSERGVAIRRYFLEVEKRYQAHAHPVAGVLTDAGIPRAALPGALDPTQTSPEAFAEMVSKAAFHDAIAAANGGQTLQAAAKALGHGPNRFFKLLREMKVLLFNNLPYQTHLDAGRFKVIERTYVDRDGIHLYTRTLVTGKGLIYLQQLLARAGESRGSGEPGASNASGASSESRDFRERAA